MRHTEDYENLPPSLGFLARGGCPRLRPSGRLWAESWKLFRVKGLDNSYPELTSEVLHHLDGSPVPELGRSSCRPGRAWEQVVSRGFF